MDAVWKPRTGVGGAGAEGSGELSSPNPGESSRSHEGFWFLPQRHEETLSRFPSGEKILYFTESEIVDGIIYFPLRRKKCCQLKYGTMLSFHCDFFFLLLQDLL